MKIKYKFRADHKFSVLVITIFAYLELGMPFEVFTNSQIEMRVKSINIEIFMNLQESE